MRTETKVVFTQEEFDAVKVIANIKCGVIHCEKCPLAIGMDPQNFVSACIRDRALAIINSIENNERMVLK